MDMWSAIGRTPSPDKDNNKHLANIFPEMGGKEEIKPQKESGN